MPRMSLRTCVVGWSWPMRTGAPGRVTSRASAFRVSACRPRLSAACCASSASASRLFHRVGHLADARSLLFLQPAEAPQELGHLAAAAQIRRAPVVHVRFRSKLLQPVVRFTFQRFELRYYVRCRRLICHGLVSLTLQTKSRKRVNTFCSAGEAGAVLGYACVMRLDGARLSGLVNCSCPRVH